MFTALITGVAITLHNLPEGLATFVATARVRQNTPTLAVDLPGV
jgi:zinc transporter ZupT